jgi:uncharacterized protein YjbI with pentapeptide repeats
MKFVLPIFYVFTFWATTAHALTCDHLIPMTREEFIAANGKASCRDLSNVDLSGLKIQYVDGSGANFQNAKFDGSYFYGDSEVGPDLRWANRLLLNRRFFNR